MAFEKDPNEIGVLWAKTGQKGPYMTGTIEGIGPVVLFAIANKSGNPKAPTWCVLKSTPRERSEGGVPTPVQSDDINW